MVYNFETIEPRYGVGSGKWGEVEKYLPNHDEGIIPFSVADMEFGTAPEIKEGLKRYIDTYALGYANPTGEYLEAVCNWQLRHHYWSIKPEWVLTTPGIVNAFHMAVTVYTDEGDGVLLMTPCYYPMYNAVVANGRRLVKSPLMLRDGHYEIDFVDFEKKLKEVKLLILCNPHNPTGRVFTVEELQKLGELCLKYDVFVCADEIHNDLILPGYQHTVFASISEIFAEHCMTCVSASKTFNLAGLQTAAVIIKNDQVRKQFSSQQKKHEINPKCNILGYEATRIAYNQCDFWLEVCMKVIDRNYQIIREFFRTELPDMKWAELEGTYLLWMDFRDFGIEDKELAELLRKEAKLFFDDGYVFGEEGKGFERWNLACPTAYIEEALPRLKQMLKKHKS
ncbi:MAG: MalY/PatB family protein [Anaerocolumna sp.]